MLDSICPRRGQNLLPYSILTSKQYYEIYQFGNQADPLYINPHYVNFQFHTETKIKFYINFFHFKRVNIFYSTKY